MSDFLRQMARLSAARAAAIGKIAPAALERPAQPLVVDGFGIIAEIKNRSPAEGALAGGEENRISRAAAYCQGGAAAISVLTEPARFDGAIEHLEEVVAAAGDVPVMRKDFLVDVAQVLEAKAAGASGVLLIAAILDDKKLDSMLDAAFEHDLFVLLESFSEEDLARSGKLVSRSRIGDEVARGKFLVGVNTRDLRTLEVDATRLQRFAKRLPTDVTAVAESGMRDADDAARVAGYGYRMALVGTALMRAKDPGTLIAAMRAAGAGAAR